MSSKKTIVAIAITTAALTVGSIGFANASPKSTTRVSTTKTSARVSAITNPITSMKGGPVNAVTSVLAALVTKGTITQAQADAIVAAVTAAQVAQREVEGSPKRVPHPDRAAMEKLVSDAIGIDTATINSRLRAGESLATIAGAKKDVLIAALVAEATKRIDAAVTAGTLTAAQATSMKSTLVAKTTAQINETRGAGFPGAPKGKKGGREHGGKGDRDHGDMGDRDDAPTA